MRPKTGIFTIASKNYLAYVRVLQKSIERTQPEVRRFLCLADTVDGYFEPALEPYELVEARDIGIPAFADMALRYDIMEFNTAIKPYMIQWLLDHTDLDVVIYLDPDIQAYARFAAIDQAFAAGASVVLTPHITRPLEDGKDPNDHHMLQAGVFNLGFIGVRRCDEARSFVDWWARRLATQAVADVRRNLFTDQRWCDLAPCFLDRLSVLKHPGYNVAYWNLAERKIVRDSEGGWTVNGQPLAFFHFSGANVERPHIVSKHQNRFEWAGVPGCQPLFDDYFERLRAEGALTAKDWPYRYGKVAGLSAPTIARMIYRDAEPDTVPLDEKALRARLIELCNAPDDMPGAPQLTRLMCTIHSLRPDLQAVFSLTEAAGRQQFVNWFHASARAEYGLPDEMMPQTRPSAAAALATPLQGEVAAPGSPGRGPSGSTTWQAPDGLREEGSFGLLELSALRARWRAVPIDLKRALAPALAALLTALDRQPAAPPDPPPSSESAAGVPEPPRMVRPIGWIRTPADVDQRLDDAAISRLMYLVWRSRDDLRSAFDLGTADGQRSFVNWFAASAQPEYGLADTALPHLDAPAAPLVSRTALGGRPGANLIGYAKAELGMGEHVRMTAAGLATTTTPFGIVNFNVPMQSRQQAELEHGLLIEGNPHRVNVFHVNADQMLRAYATLGERFFADRYNVGYWAWELARCPEAWVPITELVHEIWAPSRFIQQAFAAVTDIPVVHMPLCVAPGTPARLGREHFGLPRGRFLFLYTFDFLSFLERKNPAAAIRAFKRAFAPGDQSAGLVLKVMNIDEASPAWQEILRLIDDDVRIRVIGGTMDRGEVLALLAACDAFVSLHRSEGFGRGPAEAMYLGKPVVATRYSGNLDFTRAENACLVDYRLVPVRPDEYPHGGGQTWADADVEHAAWYMRRLAADEAWARELGARGRATMQQEFNEHVIGARCAERIARISRA
jgi:glycosyltransferase involved in cell wall biosynthesis